MPACPNYSVVAIIIFMGRRIGKTELSVPVGPFYIGDTSSYLHKLLTELSYSLLKFNDGFISCMSMGLFKRNTPKLRRVSYNGHGW